jgi:hypothetical protein
VQDHTQQGIIHLQAALVTDESQLFKFLHEKIDARPRGADHFRQSLLRNLGQDPLRLIFFAVSAAAGPKGRDASADTDAYMRARYCYYDFMTARAARLPWL